MRKAFVAIAMALSLGLAQCATPAPGQPPLTLEQQTAAIIANVQKGVATTCHVVPEVATIAAAIAAIPGLTAAAGVVAVVAPIVSAICAAVPPPASARYGAIQKYGVGPASYIGTTTVGTTTVVVTGWRTQ